MSDTENKPDPWVVWRAGFVSRWHSGEYAPELAHTADYICGHSGRMAVLAIHYWGLDVSRDLLMAIALHDVGEAQSGDLGHGVKTANPAYRRMANEIGRRYYQDELQLPVLDDVSDETYRRLDFLDRLDSFYYVRLRAPALLQKGDWIDLRRWLFVEAEDLGVSI